MVELDGSYFSQSAAYGALICGKGDFGDALVALKCNRAVARAGWNGKRMYLRLQRVTEASANTLPYIWMRTADRNRVPWLASQTDMLSADWNLVQEDLTMERD